MPRLVPFSYPQESPFFEAGLIYNRLPFLFLFGGVLLGGWAGGPALKFRAAFAR